MNGIELIKNEIQMFESKVTADELAEAIKMVTVDLLDELAELYEHDEDDQIKLVNGFVLHKSSEDGGGSVDIIYEEDWFYVINCDFSWWEDNQVKFDPIHKSEVITEAIKIANRKTFILKQIVSYEVELEVEGDSVEDVIERAENNEFDEDLCQLETEFKAIDTREYEFSASEKE
jgi:hypothetical protein